MNTFVNEMFNHRYHENDIKRYMKGKIYAYMFAQIAVSILRVVNGSIVLTLKLRLRSSCRSSLPQDEQVVFEILFSLLCSTITQNAFFSIFITFSFLLNCDL